MDKKATDDKEAKALQFNRDYIDIYSNSWGPDDKGFEVVGPGNETQAALKKGAEMVNESVRDKRMCCLFKSDRAFV